MATKKNNTMTWIAVSLGIVILVMCWFLFQKVEQESIHKLGEQEQKQRADSLEKKAGVADHTVEYLTKWIVKDSKVIDTLKTELSTVKKQLSASLGKNVSLADQVRAAKILKDTVRYVIACDSLAEENGGLVLLVNDYQHLNDSLLGKLELNQKRSDSIAKVQSEFNSDLRNGFRKADSFALAVAGDYKKEVKKVKVEKIKTKVAAGLGIAAVILALILK